MPLQKLISKKKYVSLGPTTLEVFITHREDHMPTDVKEIELLVKHVETHQKHKKNNDFLTRNNLQQRLLTFAQDLAKLDEKLDPNVCPVIYLLDPETHGLNGIKLKNAFD
jgi:hypothetical protein